MTAFEVVQAIILFAGFTVNLVSLYYKIFKEDKNNPSALLES